MSEQNTTPNHAGGSVPLAGSERPAAARIQATHGPVDSSRRIEVTVILRRQEPLTETPAEPMSREDFVARHGASSRGPASCHRYVQEAGSGNPRS